MNENILTFDEWYVNSVVVAKTQQGINVFSTQANKSFLKITDPFKIEEFIADERNRLHTIYLDNYRWIQNQLITCG